jgi:hypothetical protein
MQGGGFYIEDGSGVSINMFIGEAVPDHLISYLNGPHNGTKQVL